jgi:hypothetical protein
MPKDTSSKKLVFVHLSDIHFVKDVSGESAYDLDSGLRHALEQDAVRMLQHVGHVDGILVSGDIAFGGKVREYEIARSWLQDLADRTCCDANLVWCVPGNHDVDQSVHKSLPSLFDTYAALRQSEDLDGDLRNRLSSSENGPLMFQPLKNYHEHFGAYYGCPTTYRQPHWEDDLRLNDNSTLRIRGINSAIVSSCQDDAKKGIKLVVGGSQIVYAPENNVVYLTLCHHPPSWLIDEDAVHGALIAHSHIQLFGHKHSHSHEKINETLRLYSGAVHPVRASKNWDPRYYFLTLEVDRLHGARNLVVELFPRVWCKQSHTFVRDSGDFQDLAFVVRLTLPEWTASEDPMSDPSQLVERDTSMNINLDRKRLINRFMRLPYHSQLSILRKFDLFTEEERKTTPDVELFLLSFRKAREKDVLEQVWDAIEAESQKGGA